MILCGLGSVGHSVTVISDVRFRSVQDDYGHLHYLYISGHRKLQPLPHPKKSVSLSPADISNSLDIHVFPGFRRSLAGGVHRLLTNSIKPYYLYNTLSASVNFTFPSKG